MRTDDELIAAAWAARRHAVAPYSGYAVGAALETADGTVFGGCNVENASYGLTLCAERVALFKALSEGFREFTRIALVADGPRLVSPCGACRQVLWEFGGDLEILTARAEGPLTRRRLGTILPEAFDGTNLDR